MAVPQIQTGTYYIQTWGCQMNEEDSEQIGLYLKNAGFTPAESILEAQVVLLNTCSVRKKPEDKAFSLLGELVPLNWKNRKRVIGVCGCMAQIRAKEIRQRAPQVDFVVGTAQISEIPILVQEALESRHFETRLELPERKGAIVTDLPQRKIDRRAKTKSFVPIQYGCDKFCTFCIVPETRGRERSRPTEGILDEVRRLVDQGTKEITLLGQTVNSYGKNLVEGRVPFSKLLWMLNDINGLERIRFMSPYPTDFKQDLIETIRDCPKVMEHVHLPLQSGDNDVLKAMRRLYTIESFEEIVHKLRDSVPNISITTDIIVGFPGETDLQFEQTLNVMRRLRFDGAFMFVYSSRPHTLAADMEQVPFAVRKDRIHALVEVQNAITCEINEANVGRELEVLVEGPSPKRKTLLQGYSREFKMVHFPAAESQVGQLVQVRTEQAHLWGLSASLL
jgi:tRNA-2-methylthio-N6-dimethylallyladenosine synthase